MTNRVWNPSAPDRAGLEFIPNLRGPNGRELVSLSGDTLWSHAWQTAATVEPGAITAAEAQPTFIPPSLDFQWETGLPSNISAFERHLWSMKISDVEPGTRSIGVGDNTWFSYDPDDLDASANASIFGSFGSGFVDPVTAISGNTNGVQVDYLSTGGFAQWTFDMSAFSARYAGLTDKEFRLRARFSLVDPSGAVAKGVTAVIFDNALGFVWYLTSRLEGSGEYVINLPEFCPFTNLPWTESDINDFGSTRGIGFFAAGEDASFIVSSVTIEVAGWETEHVAWALDDPSTGINLGHDIVHSSGRVEMDVYDWSTLTTGWTPSVSTDYHTTFGPAYIGDAPQFCGGWAFYAATTTGDTSNLQLLIGFNAIAYIAVEQWSYGALRPDTSEENRTWDPAGFIEAATRNGTYISTARTLDDRTLPHYHLRDASDVKLNGPGAAYSSVEEIILNSEVQEATQRIRVEETATFRVMQMVFAFLDESAFVDGNLLTVELRDDPAGGGTLYASFTATSDDMRLAPTVGSVGYRLLTMVDDSALGLTAGTDYYLRVLMDYATFNVTDNERITLPALRVGGTRTQFNNNQFNTDRAFGEDPVAGDTNNEYTGLFYNDVQGVYWTETRLVGYGEGTLNGFEFKFDAPMWILQGLDAPASPSAVAQTIDSFVDETDLDDTLVRTAGGLPYVRLQWQSAAVNPLNLFRFHEIQRRDAVDTDWTTIANVSLQQTATHTFDDYEARVGLESEYRIRGVFTYGPTLWSTVVAATPPEPENASLFFSSNERRDLFAATVDQYPATAAERSFAFAEAQRSITLPISNRDFPVVFVPAERSGATFQRTVLVAVYRGDGSRPDPSAGPWEALRALAMAGASYVCCRDGEGNRWLGALLVPTATSATPDEDVTFLFAEITMIESTRTPSLADG